VRLFPSVVLAIAPAVTVDNASSLLEYIYSNNIVTCPLFKSASSFSWRSNNVATAFRRYYYYHHHIIPEGGRVIIPEGGYKECIYMNNIGTCPLFKSASSFCWRSNKGQPLTLLLLLLVLVLLPYLK